ncbi:hypothetical protein LJY25_06350 [Hymenobacter sp. BT175]|uniref:M949_RS01915 family surface polysaccharide biosynthesis protein n=1 Tax=Hymenobacter translucens TaxID=2886507 RepID=UPI001D0E3BB5|nr:hypothetical protein [Hymenobacter translucens]MCC2546059.1 hypothetical protein [Hymenobacter translucens]
MTAHRLLPAIALLLLACGEKKAGPDARAAAPVAAETPAPADTAAVSAAQPTRVVLLTAAQLPAGTALPGKLLEALRWTDVNGENLLVVSRRGPLNEPRPGEMEGERYVEMAACQYLRRQGRWEPQWRLRDAVRSCPFDMWLGPLPGSTAVTDLDHDGESETTLIYKLTCRSDVSPSGMKLVMHEGAAKYALRGQMVVAYDSVPVARRAPRQICCLDTLNEKRVEATGDYAAYLGRYQNEKDFRAAPPAFLDFARQQWRYWSVQDEFEQL